MVVRVKCEGEWNSIIILLIQEITDCCYFEEASLPKWRVFDQFLGEVVRAFVINQFPYIKILSWLLDTGE